ncbi:magnesium transporter [Dolichospermum sp. UHCC 0684]|jgi:magnesium transporter|uniref:Magnesium transporter MgtE n=1 Tax=Dolichospermum flos-aquae CCAP 1403/13F TaxID=315271 RepID=A0A6H2BV80_DOLFA|nr:MULTISPECIES: magnesium transporter [Nostocales]MBO1051374.1 magnesium transporter [Dolichospermum sp. DET73]MCE2696806.1 magnesium transporter [Anabaena sp. 49633_E8]MDJ0501561.1 magnesium transporter [Nostocales cyanobacterium LE14-WE4]OBQ09341.1 MAG: Mg2+ transporter [Anabaena sp. LE011-02]OBQ38997.1 MAG: Mg2+ transporter [Anabaena sp. MDT14b]QSV62791.1 MAG: magnesium transporter [Dolichospermum sp. DL01]
MLTQEIRNSLDIADLNQLKCDLNCLQPVDVGEYITQLPEKQRAIAFRLLNKDQAIDVFEYLPTEVQEDLINSLHDAQVVDLVEEMSPDERAYLFDELPAGVVKRLLQQLSPEQRQATATILGYPEGTAGRVMTTEYVRLRRGLTVGEALSKIRLQDQDKETIYYAYVTDDNRKLVSVVSLRQLLFTFPDVLIKDIASAHVVKVRTETSQEEVARIMQRYDLIAMPVVDREDRLVGIITIDDVVDILEEEATEDIQKLAGVSGDEEALSPAQVTIRKRLPWLLGIMGLYIGAASAIAPFQEVIAAVPVLAVIMPIFSNTGGTVGIQALTVTIRGLGVGEVTPADTGKILRKELLAGLGTAVALGLTMVALSLIWAKPQERWVALIAGVVMATNTMVAVTLGTLLPMGLKHLKLDPALMSGPLVTTMLDTIGFLTFLSIISVALKVFHLQS